MDWHDLRSALNTDVIDLGFYSGPIGSEAMTSLVHDHVVMLLDLSDDAKAIRQMHPQFLPGVIEGDSYRIRSDFCPSTVQTLATRRVLIAPRGMTSADAFLLTQAAASALLPVPTDSDLAQPLEVAKGLRFRLHEGARAALDDKPLSYFPSGVLVLLSGIGLAVVVELVRFITASIPMAATLGQPNDPRDIPATDAISHAQQAVPQLPATSESSDYSSLNSELIDLEIELATAPHPFTTDVRERFGAKLELIRQQLKESAKAGTLTLTQRESLLKGIRAALEEMIPEQVIPSRELPKPVVLQTEGLLAN